MKKSKSTGLLGIALACSMLLLSSGSMSAQPLYITVSSAQYTTYVEAGGPSISPISRTTISPSPFSDEIDIMLGDPSDPSSLNSHAVASAGLFAVSEQTWRTAAVAEAVSQLWFSPVADQIQTLNIQIDQGVPYDEGQISLVDLTANFELWNYGWNVYGPSDVPVLVPLGNNVPWNTSIGAANFNVVTEFLASHQYELTMIAASDATDDSERVDIQLNGLQVVPEPSIAVLLALCGATLAIWRRCWN